MTRYRNAENKLKAGKSLAEVPTLFILALARLSGMPDPVASQKHLINCCFCYLLLVAGGEGSRGGEEGTGEGHRRGHGGLGGHQQEDRNVPL